MSLLRSPLTGGDGEVRGSSDGGGQQWANLSEMGSGLSLPAYRSVP